MKNIGGFMKRFSLLFILVFAVAAFGQEGMEAPAEMAPDSMTVDMVADSAMVDTMAMDEMLMTDTTAVEEAVMEDTGDAMEAMLAEEGTMETEVTSGSALIGYTAGVNIGFPLWMSSGLANGKAAPIFGIVANTPYGFSLGPFDIGIGVELGMYDFSDVAETKGYIALATLNSSVYNTPAGAVSTEIGGGYYGESLGATAGASFSYAIPGVPLVLNPYVRANATLSAGNTGSVSWISAGANLKVDLSAIF
jgi:hypothetical protein